MKCNIETTDHLNHEDTIAALNEAADMQRDIALDVHDCTLDFVETHLRRVFRGWFVYRGGNHVALHRTVNDDRRVMIVSI